MLAKKCTVYITFIAQLQENSTRRILTSNQNLKFKIKTLLLFDTSYGY